jgi:hypothetical protein
MSIHARMMKPSRVHWDVAPVSSTGQALPVASPPRQELPFQAPARGLSRRPACRDAAHEPLPKRGSNVTYPNSVNRPCP